MQARRHVAPRRDAFLEVVESDRFVAQQIVDRGGDVLELLDRQVFFGDRIEDPEPDVHPPEHIDHLIHDVLDIAGEIPSIPFMKASNR